MGILSNPAILISTLALIVSTAALAWTVASFWWMHWRKGKLRVGGPRSYAARGSENDQLVVRIPLVFFNDGPAPIVVEDLRLRFLHERDRPPLEFTATINAFETTSKNEVRSLSTQFPVPGRQTLHAIFEFQRRPGRLLFEGRRYDLELQGRFDGSQGWAPLCQFPLHVSPRFIPQMNQCLVSYNNYPE